MKQVIVNSRPGMQSTCNPFQGLEAADNGLMEQPVAKVIARVKGVKIVDVRAENHLIREQAQAIIDAPDYENLKVCRDQAVSAVKHGVSGAGITRGKQSPKGCGGWQSQ